MTKRDFFILVIKLFGLQTLVIALFSYFPNNIAIVVREPEFSILIGAIVGLCIVIGIFWLLVFEADKIADWLKLNKGFDDDRIDLADVKGSDLIRGGTLVIGGVLIIENIPFIISQSIWILKANNSYEFTIKDKIMLTASVLNVLIGYLLVTNLDFVARMLNKK